MESCCGFHDRLSTRRHSGLDRDECHGGRDIGVSEPRWMPGHSIRPQGRIEIASVRACVRRFGPGPSDTADSSCSAVGQGVLVEWSPENSVFASAFPPDHVNRRCTSGWRNVSIIACLVFVSLCTAMWLASANSGLLDIFPNLSVPSRSQRLTAARAIYRMPVSYSNAPTSVQF